MRTAIYGAGALGTALGAYVTKAGYQIDLINHNAAHVRALQNNGARIIGKVDMSVPVTALTPDEMTGEYDVVILMTKQLDNKKVVEFLSGYLSPGGIICTCQNGLPELSVSEVIGEARTYGCAVLWGATLRDPGVSEMTSDPYALTCLLGGYNNLSGENFDYLVKLFWTMGEVVIEENLIGARWSKLLINSAFSGLSTVLGCTFGEVCDNKKSRVYAQLLIKESIDICAFANIKIKPVQGKDIVKLFDYRNPFKKWFSRMLIPIAMKQHRNIRASMLYDIKRGKKCEIEAINGVVAKFGRKFGVPTPVNDKVIEIIGRIEAGELRPAFSNLALMS